MKRDLMKKILKIAAAFLAAWVIVLIVDITKVVSGGKPIFCLPYSTADDGGSGDYIGLGYSFKLNGELTLEGYRCEDAELFFFGIRSANIK